MASWIFWEGVHAPVSRVWELLRLLEWKGGLLGPHITRRCLGYRSEKWHGGRLRLNYYAHAHGRVVDDVAFSFPTLETRRKLGRVSLRKDVWNRYWGQGKKTANSGWSRLQQLSQTSLRRLTRPSFLLVSKVGNENTTSPTTLPWAYWGCAYRLLANFFFPCPQ